MGRFTLFPITGPSNRDQRRRVLRSGCSRENRGIAILSLLDTATPFDEALRGRLTRILVTRLKVGLELNILRGHKRVEEGRLTMCLGSLAVWVPENGGETFRDRLRSPDGDDLGEGDLRH